MSEQRVVWRRQGRGGIERAYVDLRPWGGKRVALKAPDEHRALTRDDRELAEGLAAQQIAAHLKGRVQSRERAVFGLPPKWTLRDAVREHLKAKALGAVTDACLVADEHYLTRLIDRFGAGKDLGAIDTADVRKAADWLRSLPNGRGGTLSAGTVRHHLNALSNLYARARAEGWVTTGYDPVGDLLDKPTGDPAEPLWLEVPEAALYLEAARRCPAGPAAQGQPPVPFGYELVAMFLLTGGRQDEVLGLEVADVDFKRQTVTFRPNTWRRLKTEKSHRTVPLWPQLERILRPYVRGAHRPRGQLLFPSDRTGKESMLTDVRKLLDRVTARAGTLYVTDAGRRRKAEPDEIRTKAFRHTYITARLQTLDHGQPVSLWTVAQEVGHSGTSVIERTYGHLGQLRHRADVVEYRVRQHRKVLRGRLALVA